MNLNRKLYAQITVGNTTSTLGAADLDTITLRFRNHLASARLTDTTLVTFRVSHSPIEDSLSNNPASKLAMEFESLLENDPEADSPYEGISMGRVHEAMESIEFAEYQRIASKPDNRIGFSLEVINLITNNYRNRFPDCFAHFPLWVDSKAVR